ncbi:outer membrane beta-barrel protein [Roseivirga sp. BDSF3-8]|uniref:outer membrane beta-barrel protein n=1 Tax=Roseivirga sp. BDSF3-8 TaxID=3241598 RepID=UPI003531FA5D
MEKRTLIPGILCLVMMLGSLSAFAQFYVEAGVTGTDAVEDEYTAHIKPDIGIVMHAGAAFDLAKNLKGQGGLGFSTLNFSQSFSGGSYSSHIVTMDLPLSLRYRIANPIEFSGGIQLSFPSGLSVLGNSYEDEMKGLALFYMAGLDFHIHKDISITVNGLLGSGDLFTYQDVDEYGEISSVETLRLSSLRISLKINLAHFD